VASEKFEKTRKNPYNANIWPRSGGFAGYFFLLILGVHLHPVHLHPVHPLPTALP